MGTFVIGPGASVVTNTFGVGSNFTFGFSEQAVESGIVNQTGGSVTVLGADDTSGLFDGPLRIGTVAAQGSQYNLSGGTLTVANGSIDIGSESASSSFNISGGVATVRRLEIDGRNPTAPIGGILNITGGELIIGIGGMHRANNDTGLAMVNVSGGILSTSATATWVPGINFDNTAARINTGASSLTISGALVGPGGFTKVGTGTLTLTNPANLVSAVQLDAGTLVISGALAGRVTVGGGTLKGTGTIGGLTVAPGGTVAPGNSAGVLNVGPTSFAGGTVAIEINGPLAGSQYDQLNVTGTVDLASNTPITLSLGYNPADYADSFVIVSNDANDAVTGSGFFSYNGQVLTEGAYFMAGVQLFQVTYVGGSNTNDVVLLAVPEPSTASLLFGVAGSVLGLGRSRRRMVSHACG